VNVFHFLCRYLYCAQCCQCQKCISEIVHIVWSRNAYWFSIMKRKIKRSIFPSISDKRTTTSNHLWTQKKDGNQGSVLGQEHKSGGFKPEPQQFLNNLISNGNTNINEQYKPSPSIWRLLYIFWYSYHYEHRTFTSRALESI